MLKIGTTVYDGRYKIASMPYLTRELAYADISAYWKGVDCITYFDQESKMWYIITQ